MDSILASATTIVAFVLAATQLVKKYTGTDNKWLPLINLGLGVALGIGWSLSYDPENLINFMWGGAIAGLAAGGFYDLGASNLKKGSEEDGD
ncbi:hypothetical protein BCR22_07440 [Enterococcus plantarum]|uniref:holin n=1 Tax=Enterococcus plantarum TaxID=1077675 RepID=UPI00084D700C|nr:holin [Enterococcus plantarum]OEG09420.1 hypothetical protein BCR22_07440 [Enterococcus plantarum]